MINKIVTTVSFLVGAGTKGIAGLEKHVELNIPHARAVDLPGRLAALSAAEVAYHEARIQLKDRRIELDDLVTVVRRFMMVARETLKPQLGVKYSQSWDAAGFTRTLQLPRSGEPLLTRLQLIGNYLELHPIADAGPSLSPLRAKSLEEQLTSAIAALAQHKCFVAQAFAMRNEKVKAMEKGLRTLLSELHLVLDPLDSRWFAFGFQKPGQKKSPEVPEKVSMVVITPTVMQVKWEPSARAEHYRVWKKVIGVDEDYLAVGSTAETNFTLEVMEVAVEVEVAVSAVNPGGESRLSVKAVVLD